ERGIMRSVSDGAFALAATHFAALQIDGATAHDAQQPTPESERCRRWSLDGGDVGLLHDIVSERTIWQQIPGEPPHGIGVLVEVVCGKASHRQGENVTARGGDLAILAENQNVGASSGRA